ncbi:MAG: hypothetical protein JSU86_06995, partial [Phycisphaerales bacterium]
MRTHFSRLPYGAVLAIAAFSVSAVNVVREDGGQDFARLMRLGESDGVDYLRERDALLAGQPTQWDVDAAAARSWEAGLAAFILNGRLGESEAFAKWDAQRPILRANLRYYDWAGASVEEGLAFLLEKMWKGATAKEREWAYNDLQLIGAKFTVGVGNTALWRAIWENCPDDRFKAIVILYIASSDDPTVQPIIVEVLDDGNDAVPLGFKYRCLQGLRYRDTEQTVDAILDGWDQLTSERAWTEKALAALCANGGKRARQFVHGLALSPDQDEWTRADAAAGCCLRPHPDDPDMFRKFFTGPGSVKMKTKALKGLRGRNAYPLEPIRPVLREIITTSDDEDLTESAALTLTSCYRHAKELNERAVAED